MDVLRQVALFSVIYLFSISGCFHFLFPKKIIKELSNEMLLFFELKVRSFRNITLGFLLLFPLLLGILVEIMPSELKLHVCSAGVFIALSTGFLFAESKSYLSFILNEKNER